MTTLHNFIVARPRLSATLEVVRARSTPLALLALFAVALALRLYGLDAQSLWLDEGGTWAEITRKSWGALLAELVSADAGYPLYHLLLKGWTALAGVSEWALRFPSALAGAGAVAVVYLAATEIECNMQHAKWPGITHFACCIIPALFVAISPFALWHAQDAKAYSLLLLVSALELWALLRAVRRGERRAWLLVLALALVSLFVHRLALLLVAGVALAAALTRGRRTTNDERRTTNDERRTTDGSTGWGALGRWSLVVGRWSVVGGRWLWLFVSGMCGALGVAGTILAARGEAAGAERAGVGPLVGVGLIFARFSLDRWPGDVDGFLGLPVLVWLLPFAALTLWGLALLARDASARRPEAIALLCALVVPLGLLALTLALAPIFQARYAVPAFPAWVLTLWYPLRRRTTNDERRTPKAFPEAQSAGTTNDEPGITAGRQAGRGSLVVGRWSFVAALLTSLAMLLQPGAGLFSGAPVKEQWRQAVAELAWRAQPDDLVIVHPYYVLPMYDYYAPRVTLDPLPRPVTFPIFAEGDRGGAHGPTREELLEFVRRRYEPFFGQQAQGAKRALLLIAPEHARTVDPPPTPGDEFGWLGLRFQYPQRTWPCGGVTFVGVALMCQSFPETFGAGAAPQPVTPLPALFGGELRLRGYTLVPHGGALRPGGALPLTLFWEAAAPPTRRYHMFLHLCRACDSPPPAGADGPPLFGYPPAGDTTTWRVGDPVHDERALRLPPGLPPGRYTLLLGVYPAGDPAIAARLPVATDGRTLPAGRLVLGEVQVGP
jgi:hypothetical protein